jgi:hypothetical protein
MKKSIKRIKSNKRRKSSRLKKLRSKNKKRLAGGANHAFDYSKFKEDYDKFKQDLKKYFKKNLELITFNLDELYDIFNIVDTSNMDITIDSDKVAKLAKSTHDLIKDIEEIYSYNVFNELFNDSDSDSDRFITNIKENIKNLKLCMNEIYIKLNSEPEKLSDERIELIKNNPHYSINMVIMIIKTRLHRSNNLLKINLNNNI